MRTIHRDLLGVFGWLLVMTLAAVFSLPATEHWLTQEADLLHYNATKMIAALADDGFSHIPAASSLDVELSDHSSHRFLADFSTLIPSRKQWDCNFGGQTCCQPSCRRKKRYHNKIICDGYCGSVAVQESLLFYGAYVSQGWIRRTVASNDDAYAVEILFESRRKPEIQVVAELLGLGTAVWYSNQMKETGNSGLTSFYNWAVEQINSIGAPVATSVNFQGLRSQYYWHIVTSVGVSVDNNGLWINDHYADHPYLIKLASLPRPGSRCHYKYCFSQHMYGVALHPPTNVSRAELVRIQVVNNVVETTNTTIPNNKEPNWTCLHDAPSMMTLRVTPAYPNLLDSNQQWYIAMVGHMQNATEIRAAAATPHGVFGGSPLACWPLPLGQTNSSVQTQVASNEAAFFRVVDSNAGCPL